MPLVILRARGFVVELEDDGQLFVSPADAITEADADYIRQHRDRIVEQLTERDRWDTRAAILMMEEADGLVAERGVSGTLPAIRDAAAMVANAYAMRDMDALKHAIAEFGIAVRHAESRQRDERTGKRQNVPMDR